MAEQEKDENSSQGEVGPSIVLGLVGAVVVLLLLAGAIWGVGKIISEIRESDDETQEEQLVAEDSQNEGSEETNDGDSTDAEGDTSSEDGDINGNGATDSQENEPDSEDADSGSEEQNEDAQEEEGGDEQEDGTTSLIGGIVGDWIANNYESGDITGDTHEVVWGDTLWEIAEARYGSGFEWGKIRDANFDIIGYLPNGSHALIIPGQVLALP